MGQAATVHCRTDCRAPPRCEGVVQAHCFVIRGSIGIMENRMETTIGFSVEYLGPIGFTDRAALGLHVRCAHVYHATDF